MPAAKAEPEPRVTARVKVRPKAQLTLPEEIRSALHIGEGDEVEFAVQQDGTVTIRGYIRPGDRGRRPCWHPCGLR